MKIPSTFTWLSAAVFTATLVLLTLTRAASCGSYASVPYPALNAATAPAAAPTSENRIQIAFLLDTSSSMDGLIDQAKARLWNILSEILKAEKDGEVPDIEIALYHYGNSGLLPQTGYIEQIVPLTTDVDKFSEKLFALTTGGGDEYCGHVIQTSTKELAWDDSDRTIKLIYIAGNESFLQGEVVAKEALAKARARGIIVNTIFCGDPNSSEGRTWNNTLTEEDGDFFYINQDETVVFIASPYDDAIESSNQRLNKTYIAIGQDGSRLQANQAIQDSNAASYSKANLSSRARYKASAKYKNESWDLVDAYDAEPSRIKKEKATLPEELKNLDDEALVAKIKAIKAERELLQAEIQALTQKRDAYVAQARKEAASGEDNTLGARITKSVRKRLVEKKYTIKE